MTPPKLCIHCRWFKPHRVEAAFGYCSRRWIDLVTGAGTFGHDIPAWHARKDFCGPIGEGWEEKEKHPMTNVP